MLGSRGWSNLLAFALMYAIEASPGGRQIALELRDQPSSSGSIGSNRARTVVSGGPWSGLSISVVR